MRIHFHMLCAGAISHSEAGFCGEGLERNVGMVLLFRVNIFFQPFQIANNLRDFVSIPSSYGSK
jgi:hypothetical protein